MPKGILRIPFKRLIQAVTPVPPFSALRSFEPDLTVSADNGGVVFERTLDEPWSISFWYKTVVTGSTQVNPLSLDTGDQGIEPSIIDGVTQSFSGVRHENSAGFGSASWTPPRARFSWQLVVFTYDGSRGVATSSFKMYWNGKQDTDYSTTNDPPAGGTTSFLSPQLFWGGASGLANDTNFVRVKDLVLWNTDLSQSDVNALWNNSIFADVRLHPQYNTFAAHHYDQELDTVTVMDDVKGTADLTYTNVTSGMFVADVPPTRLNTQSLSYGASGVAASGVVFPATVAGVRTELMFKKQWDDAWTIMWWAKNEATTGVNYTIFENT